MKKAPKGCFNAAQRGGFLSNDKSGSSNHGHDGFLGWFLADNKKGAIGAFDLV
ncbi:hypothetical protein CFU_3686 [Collimonas fungivorans Ter331]|uniref:Uncharacterized protein n=1 Tax=Collimonas fungivorans (strain Ter331) TaxID=1005048 RepID=G0AAY6_COLFT|nr:hypothetical protein CFU_3686 [Collimonas fungivorans Ter331]